ncbi:MAG: glycerate kinase [Calditrichaceae bacterium]
MKNIARRMIDSAIKTVDPYHLIHDQLSIDRDSLKIQEKRIINLSEYENIYVIGTGKGAAPMAYAMEELLGNRLKEGAINVKYGHGQRLNKINLFEAGHPVLDQNTLKNTKTLLEIADKAGKDDLVFVLITGGGSALMELLPDNIELADLAELTQLLLSSGAVINEINTIRKHLSLVKGGQLAKRIAPARTISLILSDVIGDPIESIASGPTAPDPSTYSDSMRILEKYGLMDKIPVSIFEYLNRGKNGSIKETPKKIDVFFKAVENYIIGNNALALSRLKEQAEKNGFKTILLTDRVEGEAKEIARLLAGIIKSGMYSGFPVASPGCIILGGEPTVTLSGSGKGGRNQEITLAMAELLKDVKSKFYFCSFGTDGTDGPTDAAGAWIDEKTKDRIRKKNLSVTDHLKNNDSYHFFKHIDQLLITGPTRTNVMDVIFCLF